MRPPIPTGGGCSIPVEQNDTGTDRRKFTISGGHTPAAARRPPAKVLAGHARAAGGSGGPYPGTGTSEAAEWFQGSSKAKFRLPTAQRYDEPPAAPGARPAWFGRSWRCWQVSSPRKASIIMRIRRPRVPPHRSPTAPAATSKCSRTPHRRDEDLSPGSWFGNDASCAPPPFTGEPQNRADPGLRRELRPKKAERRPVAADSSADRPAAASSSFWSSRISTP